VVPRGLEKTILSAPSRETTKAPAHCALSLDGQAESEPGLKEKLFFLPSIRRE
jgi:hypothetical protein